MNIVIVGAGIAGTLLAEYPHSISPCDRCASRKPISNDCLVSPLWSLSTPPSALEGSDVHRSQAISSVAQILSSIVQAPSNASTDCRVWRTAPLKSAQKYETYYAQSDIALELIENQVADKDLPFRIPSVPQSWFTSPLLPLTFKILFPSA